MTRFSRPTAFLVASTFFMENLDGTIIQTAAPAIARDLKVDAVDVTVPMVAYLLAVAIVIPASAWLARRVGDRTLFIAAATTFTIASALCALAPTLELLTAARALQGMGGALLIPVGRLVVLRQVTPSQLLDAIAYLTWPAVLAPALAPALGGVLTDTVGWRWIFLINLPLGAAAALSAIRLIPRTEPEPDARFDLRGWLILTAALLLIIGGAQVHVPLVALSAILVGSVVALLGVRAMRRAANPLLDWSLLGIASFRVSNVSGGVYRLMITGAPLLYTLLLQLGLGWSATQAGLTVVALFVGNLVMKSATSPLIRALGFRRVLVWSNIAGIAVLLFSAWVEQATPVVALIILLFAGGAFRSVGFSAYNTLQFADVSPERTNDANALASTLQQVAKTLGVAVAAALITAGNWATAGLDGPRWLGYDAAFLLAAALLVVPLVGALMLARDSGAEVALRR